LKGILILLSDEMPWDEIQQGKHHDLILIMSSRGAQSTSKLPADDLKLEIRELRSCEEVSFCFRARK